MMKIMKNMGPHRTHSSHSQFSREWCTLHHQEGSYYLSMKQARWKLLCQPVYVFIFQKIHIHFVRYTKTNHYSCSLSKKFKQMICGILHSCWRETLMFIFKHQYRYWKGSIKATRNNVCHVRRIQHQRICVKSQTPGSLWWIWKLVINR